jgi:hypothetical protein
MIDVKIQRNAALFFRVAHHGTHQVFIDAMRFTSSFSLQYGRAKAAASRLGEPGDFTGQPRPAHAGKKVYGSP